MSIDPEERLPSDIIGIEYTDGLYGYAMMLTRNPAEAEDLVQETFLRALKAMHRLRPNSNMKGWLFTILRNIWLNELRSRRSTPQLIELEDKNGKALEIPGKLEDSLEILA